MGPGTWTHLLLLNRLRKLHQVLEEHIQENPASSSAVWEWAPAAGVGDTPAQGSALLLCGSFSRSTDRSKVHGSPWVLSMS